MVYYAPILSTDEKLENTLPNPLNNKYWDVFITETITSKLHIYIYYEMFYEHIPFDKDKVLKKTKYLGDLISY